MPVIDASRSAKSTAIRRRWRRLLALGSLGLVAWVGWTWWATRRDRVAMSAAESAMARGLYGMAARELVGILTRRPNSDEARYALGLCEQARGRIKEAGEQWARVEPGSASWHRAVTARLRLLHDAGRLADAEKLLYDAADDPRNDRTDMLVLLVPIDSEIGRSDEAARLVEALWERMSGTGELTQAASIQLVRLHIELTSRPPTVENLRRYLDLAGRLAPDDDRVWLGHADLAIRTGDLDAAGRRLDACLRRRPDDPAVWKARLNRALAAGEVEAVREALRHIPAEEAAPAQAHRLRAWLRARRGDVDGERRELERLIAADPADRAALDRLIQLAAKDGPADRAAELRRQREEGVADLSRYRALYERTQPIRDAEEMADLATRLGRTFEARVFLSLALSEEPGREDLRQALARLATTRDRAGPPGRSLAEVVADESGRDQRADAGPIPDRGR